MKNFLISPELNWYRANFHCHTKHSDGAYTPEQVKENIAYFDAPTLSESVMEKIREGFAEVDIPAIMTVLSRPKA